MPKATARANARTTPKKTKPRRRRASLKKATADLEHMRRRVRTGIAALELDKVARDRLLAAVGRVVDRRLNTIETEGKATEEQLEDLEALRILLDALADD
jgi:hypothetical protein